MKNVRALGLLTLSLVASSALATSAVDTHAKKSTHLWNTTGKSISGLVLGAATGAARIGTHAFITGPIVSKIHGPNNCNFLRKATAYIAAAALHLTANAGFEKARTDIAERIEGNVDADAKNGTGLVASVARATDYVAYTAAVTATAHIQGKEALLRGISQAPADYPVAAKEAAKGKKASNADQAA